MRSKQVTQKLIDAQVKCTCACSIAKCGHPRNTKELTVVKYLSFGESPSTCHLNTRHARVIKAIVVNSVTLVHGHMRAKYCRTRYIRDYNSCRYIVIKIVILAAITPKLIVKLCNNLCNSMRLHTNISL